MNKLFSKIAALSVGLAMAIGVGVAVGSRAAKVVKAAETTVGMTAFSAISGSVDSDPYITYEARQGSAANAPVVNNSQIRVYQNGGEFEVNSADGASMTSVTVSSSMATSVLVSVDDTAEGSNRSIAANGSTTVDSISANSVLFTCMGTDKNSRLYVSSLSVTYQTGGVVTTYTITYDANGGSGTMEDTSSANPSVAACTFIAPEGKIFSQWNTASDGTGVAYEVDDQPKQDLDLFAIWGDAPLAVLFEDVGAGLSSTVSTTVSTTTLVDTYSSNEFTFNHLQCKKQNTSAPYAIFMTKSAGAFISNSTEMPGPIEKVEVFANSGASGSATYDVAFGATEYTTATAGIGAVNITGGSSHEFECNVDDAKYFCITLGANYNGQVSKILVTYSEGSDPSLKNMTIKDTSSAAQGQSYLWSGSQDIYPFTAEDEDGLVSNVTWSVSDTTVATIKSNGRLTCVKPGNVTIYAEAEGYNKASASISIIKGSLESIVVSGEMSKTTYTTAEQWSHDGLVATATYHSGWTEDVASTATWTYNPSELATSVTSVVATATIEDVSGSSSAQAVTVTVPPADPGTEDNPYTVAQARAQIDGGSDLNGKYVTGIVSRIVSAYSTQYQNVSFNISADGTESSAQLEAFREKSTYSSTVKVGDVVVVYGNLKKYNSTYELDAGCQIKSLTPAPTPETVYSIQDIYSAPGGSPVEIDGYFVGAVSDGIYLMDGEYGIFVYGGSAPEGATVNDTKLHVVGTIGSFHNLIQVIGPTVTVNASAEVATPINYTLTGSESSSNLSIESRRMVEKGVISSITIGDTAYTPTYEGETPTVDTSKDIFLTVNSIQVIYKKSDVTQSVFDSLFGYLLNGKNVNVESFTSFFDSSFQLRFSSVVEATEGYTAEKFAADLLEKTDAVCEGYDGVTNNKEALAAVWLELQANVLSDEEIARFNDEENDFADARARYDYLVGKYGLTDFLGRNPAPIAGAVIYGLEASDSTNNMMIIIVTIAATSAIALGALLIIKKKKQK